MFNYLQVTEDIHTTEKFLTEYKIESFCPLVTY